MGDVLATIVLVFRNPRFVANQYWLHIILAYIALHEINSKPVKEAVNLF